VVWFCVFRFGNRFFFWFGSVGNVFVAFIGSESHARTHARTSCSAKDTLPVATFRFSLLFLFFSFLLYPRTDRLACWRTVSDLDVGQVLGKRPYIIITIAIATNSILLYQLPLKIHLSNTSLLLTPRKILSLTILSPARSPVIHQRCFVAPFFLIDFDPRRVADFARCAFQ
jgi:hypothetical protein